MSINLGPVATSYVELDVDLKPFESTMKALRQRQDTLTHTVKLEGDTKGGKGGKGSIMTPVIGGAVAFGAALKGGLGFLASRLAFMQGESRVMGLTLEKSMSKASSLGGRMVDQLRQVAKYSKDADRAMTRAALAAKIPKLKASASSNLRGAFGNNASLASIFNPVRQVRAMIGIFQSLRVATNSTLAAFLNFESRVSTSSIIVRRSLSLMVLPLRATIGAVRLATRIFGTYDGRVREAAGRLGVFGTIARSVVNPVRAIGQAVNASGSALGKLSGFAGGVVNKLGLIGAIGGGIVATGLYKSVQAASSLNEAMSYAKVRWGDNYEAVMSFTNALAETTGAAKSWTLESMNMFGGILKDAGYADVYVGKMSQNLTKLSQDLASARNVSTDEAQNLLRQGLSGETEGLKRIGVVMNEAQVAAEAMRLGISKNGKDMSEAAKIAARYSLLTKKLGDDQGDLGRTGESVANQQRELAGRFENLMAVIGEKLLPVASAFLGLLNSFVGTTAHAAEGSGGWFDWLAEKVKDVFDTIGMIFRNSSEIWDLMVLQTEKYGKNIGEVWLWVGEAFISTAEWMADNWQDIVKDLGGMLFSAFNNTIANIKKLWTDFTDFLNDTDSKTGEFKGLTEGFKRASKELKLPELKLSEIDEKALAKINDRIQANEAKGPDKPKDVPYQAVDVAAAARSAGDLTSKKGKDDKAEFVDLASYFKKLQTGAFGNDVPKQQLQEAQRQTKTLENIETYIEDVFDFMENLGPMPAVAGK